MICHTCGGEAPTIDLDAGRVVGAHRAPCGAVCGTGSYHATGELYVACMALDIHSVYRGCPRGCAKPDSPGKGER